jgi:predicted TIM-barrel fold metal-dependent hydrolase
MRHVDEHAASTRELRELAGRQLGAWTSATRELLPAGCHTVDAHCHLGLDSDGSSQTAERLVKQLDRTGMEHGIVMALHQPGGYVEENRVLREAAAASGGRLHALHRCDPNHADAATDARAGLTAGAVGLKWHPRAEQFSMAHDVARATAAVADEFGVPILIHAGRGMDRLGEGVVELAREFPRATFVLAHAAVSDLSWIIDATRDVPNVAFDTSWWRPTDIAALLAAADPARVIYGSDPPYGTPDLGLHVTVRIARACGWDDAAMHALMGGNARRLFGIESSGEIALPAPTMGARHFPVEDIAFRRAAEYLASGIQIEVAEGDGTEAFELACSALDLPPSHELARSAELLQACIRVGVEILRRARADVAAPGSESSLRFTSRASQRGFMLLVSTLTHLATPELPIAGVERAGWHDDA